MTKAILLCFSPIEKTQSLVEATLHLSILTLQSQPSMGYQTGLFQAFFKGSFLTIKRKSPQMRLFCIGNFYSQIQQNLLFSNISVNSNAIWNSSAMLNWNLICTLKLVFSSFFTRLHLLAYRKCRENYSMTKC